MDSPILPLKPPIKPHMRRIEAFVEPTVFDHNAPPRLESRPWSFAGLVGLSADGAPASDDFQASNRYHDLPPSFSRMVIKLRNT